MVVVLALPAEHERQIDLRERAQPLLLLLALDLDVRRLERLPELPEYKHSIDSRAAREGAEQHLGGAHRLVVAEHAVLVDARGVTGGGLDVELHLDAGPAR